MIKYFTDKEHIEQLKDYFRSSKSPFYSFLFVVPLMMTYEIAAFVLNKSDIEGLRNGADVVTKQILSLFGMAGFYGFSILVLLILIALLYHEMKDKEIDFIVTDSLNITIKSDQARLRQILDNMIKNAVDFAPIKNGKIEVIVNRDNGKMIFHVKDNGVGIPKDKQKNIFKKFYQVDTSHRRKHGGTGLGLVICKGIVEGLGGKIWFESEPGIATEFSFDIPTNGKGDLK